MFLIVKFTSAIFGSIVVFETWLITLALGVVITPISFFLSVLIGVPAYLISAFGGGAGNSAIARMDSFAWGPIRWAVRVVGNIGDRFMSILNGEPSGKRAEMLKRIEDIRKRTGKRTPSLPEDLQKFRDLDNSATAMLIVALVANFPLLAIILIS